MVFKEKIKASIERIFGRHIYNILPLGMDPLADIQSRMPAIKLKTIFDIGANIGQSAISFKKYFPTSKLYCFEPVSSTFTQLRLNLSNYSGIHFEQLALGAVEAKLSIELSIHSDQNTLTKLNFKKDAINTETIEVNTLQDYCTQNKIEHIDYLKIDTEGFDLEVLKGAHSYLIENKIDFIEIEVGMNKTNELHVPFEQAKEYLEQKGYYIFAIYEQMHEWKMKKPILRRVNILFISSRLV